MQQGVASGHADGHFQACKKSILELCSPSQASSSCWHSALFFLSAVRGLRVPWIPLGTTSSTTGWETLFYMYPITELSANHIQSRGGKPSGTQKQQMNWLSTYCFSWSVFRLLCCPLKQIIPVYYADGQFLSMLVQLSISILSNQEWKLERQFQTLSASSVIWQPVHFGMNSQLELH